MIFLHMLANVIYIGKQKDLITIIVFGFNLVKSLGHYVIELIST